MIIFCYNVLMYSYVYNMCVKPRIKTRYQEDTEFEKIFK